MHVLRLCMAVRHFLQCRELNQIATLHIPVSWWVYSFFSVLSIPADTDDCGCLVNLYMRTFKRVWDQVSSMAFAHALYLTPIPLRNENGMVAHVDAADGYAIRLGSSGLGSEHAGIRITAAQHLVQPKNYTKVCPESIGACKYKSIEVLRGNWSRKVTVS